MNTLTAIGKVLKICPRAKGESTFSYVRFCSASGDTRAHVYATDGFNFLQAFVNEDLPNALIPSEPLRSIVKHRGEVTVLGLANGVIEIKTPVGRTKLQGESYEKFPSCPVAPELENKFVGKNLKRILYAAASEKYDLQYAVLSFSEDRIEAYDRARFARLIFPNKNSSTHWTGLVAAKLFKAWPAGQALTGSDGTHAFFQMNDEVRIGAFQRQFFPDTATNIPIKFTGNRVIVDIVALRTAVQCSLGVSARDFLRVEVSDNGVTIYPFGVMNKDGKDMLCSYANTYSATIPILHTFDREVNPCTLNLNGKFVQAALQHVTTSNVILGYGDDGDSHHPIRIETGEYLACIWQLVI